MCVCLQAAVFRYGGRSKNLGAIDPLLNFLSFYKVMFDCRGAKMELDAVITNGHPEQGVIPFVLGSYKFLAHLEHIRSYTWSFGHSDPDLRSAPKLL